MLLAAEMLKLTSGGNIMIKKNNEQIQQNVD